MFKKLYNSRFTKRLWTEEKLADKAPYYCICTYCAKSDIRPGIICPKHEEFMQLTQRLQIAAPVFACNDFEELIGNVDSDRIRAEWKAQLELWAK